MPLIAAAAVIAFMWLAQFGKPVGEIFTWPIKSTNLSVDQTICLRSFLVHRSC
jgi:hypothetical protein